MTDLDIYEELIRLSRRGEPCALATVVAHSGSSPRKTGAKMLVHANGSSLGSVGGGPVENQAIETALQVISSGRAKTLSFTLTEENGFVCGGSMTIFIEPQGKLPQLVIFGAGHVGRAVTSLAHGCGFRVLWLTSALTAPIINRLPALPRFTAAP